MRPVIVNRFPTPLVYINNPSICFQLARCLMFTSSATLASERLHPVWTSTCCQGNRCNFRNCGKPSHHHPIGRLLTHEPGQQNLSTQIESVVPHSTTAYVDLLSEQLKSARKTFVCVQPRRFLYLQREPNNFIEICGKTTFKQQQSVVCKLVIKLYSETTCEDFRNYMRRFPKLLRQVPKSSGQSRHLTVSAALELVRQVWI